jgi:DNA-binding NarL/FixJ family response regulator
LKKSDSHISLNLRPCGDIFRDRKPFAEFQKIFSGYLSQCGDKISEKDLMEATLQLSFCEAVLTNTDEAARLLKKCEAYMLKHGRKEEKAAIHHIYCRLYLQHSEYEQALAEGIRSLHLFRQLDLPFLTMNTSTCCGMVCARLNLFTEAIDYLNQAHTIALAQGDNRAAILCLANLNDILVNVLPVQDCIRLNEDLLIKIQQEHKGAASTAEAGTCMQLAHLYATATNLSRADAYIHRALAILTGLPHLPPHHFLYTNLYAVRAEIAAGRGDEAGMLRHAQECSGRARLIQKKSPEIDILFIQFRFYIGQRDIATARSYLDRVSALIDPADRDAMYLLLNENKCLYYHALGDSAGELQYFKLVHEYKIKVQQEALASRVNHMASVYELEMMQKEAEIQKKELDFKTQELNMVNYYLQQRDQLLTHLQQSTNELKKQKAPADVIVNTITEKIKQASGKEDSEKMRFKEKFDETQREFIARLHLSYQGLSTTECRVCALLRSGFNTKEIANLLSSSVRTIENHRANIRRKMGLGRRGNLNLALTEIA